MKIKASAISQLLTAYNERWSTCTACPLHERRCHTVLYRGQVPCQILFIGEAPGFSENAIGQPFIGPAGRLLDDEIIAPVYRCQAFTYAITNTVACIPLADNTMSRTLREPTADEITKCLPRLQAFFDLAQPLGIVYLGDIALTLYNKLKATFLTSLPSLAIQHPAYLLRIHHTPLGAAGINRSVLKLSKFLQKVLS